MKQSLQQLITGLGEIHSQSLSHEERKGLLLNIHQVKVSARKEQQDALTNELIALENSLGFGQENRELQLDEIRDHISRLRELSGVTDTELISLSVDENPTTITEAMVPDTDTTEVDGQLSLITTAPLHLTLCNCKSRDEAREIARGLVENRLAACVNFIANIGAIYRWQDTIEDVSECQLQIKSVPERDEAIKNYINMHHSNEVPEIITMPIQQASQDYLEWVIQETKE